jgi:hypothetical protein
MDFATLTQNLIERNNRLDALSLYDDGRRADPFGRDHSTGQESMRTQDIYLPGKTHSPILVGTAFYEILSPSIYSLLSEAAAKESMST